MIAFILFEFAIGYLGFGLYIIFKNRNSGWKTAKIQTEIIVITFLITISILALIHIIIPLFGMNVFSFGIIAFPVALLGICYAKVRYKMMFITAELANEYILGNMNDPVIIIEDEFLIKEANSAALETIGYGKEEIKGIPIQKLIPGTDLNQSAIREFIKAGTVKNLEVELFTKSNRFIPCLVSASSIYSNSKEFMGIACVFHDITDRKNTEIIERKKNEERNQQTVKMEALGTLAGGIAHDFNNILAGIVGYTELTLEDLEAGSDLSDNLLEVLKLGERAKKLISQILTFSRRTIIEPHIVDMRVIIQEILKMIKTTTSSSIEIKYDFSGNSPFVFADPGEMQQLIMNLCVNAQLAMAEKGGILQVIMTEIMVDQDTKIQYQNINQGKYIKIQVVDNGCGMEKATMDRIFEPFYTTRGVQGGTGLGLSVVHGIIRSYGGIITVDSEPNKGSTFTIFFPQAKDPLNSESIDEKTTNRSLARILFVDDEESIVNTTEKILRREGYAVTGVLGGRNALNLFRSNTDSFDIVITDQSMPDMTGIHLIEELKNIRGDIPVILCSGYGHEIDDEKVKSLNIGEFLLKPVSKSQYVNAIEKVMNKDA